MVPYVLVKKLIQYDECLIFYISHIFLYISVQPAKSAKSRPTVDNLRFMTR